MLRTEGNGHRHTPSVQHSCGAPEGARSRKFRPVLCLGNRALNGRPTGDAEVCVARCPVTERLVGSDAVVDVAEAGGLHRKRSTKFPRPAPLPPGIPSSIAALPASTKRLRHRLIDSVETPWRWAASAIVISPDITASTICSRVSTGTGSLDLLKIVSPVTVSS